MQRQSGHPGHGPLEEVQVTHAERAQQERGGKALFSVELLDQTFELGIARSVVDEGHGRTLARLEDQGAGQVRRDLVLGHQIVLEPLRERRDHPLGYGRRQVHPPYQRIGDRGAFLVAIDHPVEYRLAQGGALVADQPGNGLLVAGVDQGLGDPCGDRRPLGDRRLLRGLLAAQDLDQILLGQDLGKLEHGQGDAVHVLRQRERHVVRQIRGRLEMRGERLADQDPGVLHQGPEDVLRDPPLGRAEHPGVELRRDLGGRAGAGTRRGVDQQALDIVPSQALRGGCICHRISLGIASLGIVFPDHAPGFNGGPPNGGRTDRRASARGLPSDYRFIGVNLRLTKVVNRTIT